LSTFYVERHNLTMRMSMRRFTRLTHAFSKEIQNHAAMVAIHAVHYNYARIHKSLLRQWPLTRAIMFGRLRKWSWWQTAARRRRNHAARIRRNWR